MSRKKYTDLELEVINEACIDTCFFCKNEVKPEMARKEADDKVGFECSYYCGGCNHWWVTFYSDYYVEFIARL